MKKIDTPLFESKPSIRRKQLVAEKQTLEGDGIPVLMWSGGQHSTALGILMVKSGMKFTIAVQRRWYDKLAGIPAKLPHQEAEYSWYKKWFNENGIPVVEYESYIDAMDVFHPYSTGRRFQDATTFEPLREQPFKGSVGLTWRSCTMQLLLQSGIATGWKINQQLWCGTVKDYHKTSFAHLNKGQLATQKFLPFYNEGMTHEDVMKIYNKYDMPKPSPEVGYMCWFCPQCSNEEIAMIRDQYPELYHLHRGNMLNVDKHFIDNRVFQSNAWSQEFTGYLQHNFKKRNPKDNEWLRGRVPYGYLFEETYNMKNHDKRFDEV